MSNNKKIILILLVSLSLLGSFVLFSNTPPPNLPLIKGEEKGGGQAILEIDGTRYQGEVMEKTSVYDFMDRLRRDGKMDFTERNYIGMGKFIVSINGVRGDGNKNWIYYVNDKKMEIGISTYKIKGGDVVSWKYEDSI